MNEKITNFFKSTRKFIGKHSPEILTGVGVAGMITSTILAVKATPKALELMDDEVRRQNRELVNNAQGETVNQISKLNAVDTIKVAWKPYVPAALTCVASATCIIGASAVNAKRNAALATAYAISERTLIRYRDKVIDTIGEKKEKEVREKIAQDEVNKVTNKEVIVTSKGNTLCVDAISGRCFKSDMNAIQKTVNELNRRMTHENYISLEEFYYELGLEPTKNSSRLGWNLDDGLIEINFSSCLNSDGEPCLYVDYMVSPRYEYDKLM